MFDKLSIRTKLIGIVAAPLAVMLVIAGLGFVDRRDEAADTRRDVARLEAVDAVAALQHAIQLESLQSVAFLASDAEEVPEGLIAQRAEVDAAAENMAEAMKDVSFDSSAVAASGVVERAVRQVDASLRPQVDDRSLDWTWVESLYRNVLSGVPTVTNRLVSAIGDGELARGAESVVALSDYATTEARIGTVLAGVAEEGRFPTVSVGGEADDEGENARRGFDEAVAAAEQQLAVVSAQSGAQVRTRMRNQMVGGDVRYFAEVVEEVSGLPTDAAVDIDPERWTPSVQATLDQLREIAAEQASTVLDAAEDRAASAERASQLYLIGAAIAVLGALALAVYVATSIARPVMSLTEAADRVATEQLPRLVEALRNPNEDDLDHLRPSVDGMDVGGGRELTRLSQSVNSIQDMAVTVATEQASLLRKGIGDIFINLARRNQGLLDRQLEYIDELEAQEDDPDQLEHLFKLDHMATRMRRNAESLLVLAGAEPSRRRGNPVPMSKVSLAAVGEIEHFARVDLLDVEEAEVVSNAAADIAHLLSELMENATQFSPPDARVEVVGHRTSGSYTLSISDQGIGMSPDQLTEANELLARPPLLGLTLARTLGFIVVGRLAARHGITVRLVSSPAGGITSIVTLPSNVLVDAAPRLDLTGPAPSTGGEPKPAPTQKVDTPSSILPPFEYYSGPIDDDPVPADGVPATFAEAVPTADALDEELSRVTEVEPAPLASAPRLVGPEPLPDEAAPIARATPLFGPSDRPAPAGPEPLPTREPTGPRLFGTAPGDAPGSLPSRTRGATAPPVPPSVRRAPADGTAPANGSEPANGSTPADGSTPTAPAGPELTSAGLVKRVPRRAGANRAVPGSDGPSRAATTSTRSPEEVRSMLSRFHSGKQRAGLSPVPTDPDTSPSKDS